jgi:acyl-CoA thioester hydrolase
MIEETYELEVPFFDVDSMFVVWHGHYCKYIELARCKLLDNIGYNYLAMANSAYSFPIIDIHIKYIQPLRFNQKIKIIATLIEWQVRLKIEYVIYDADSGSKLTAAHTVQAAVNRHDGQLQLCMPAKLIENVNAVVQASTHSK